MKESFLRGDFVRDVTPGRAELKTVPAFSSSRQSSLLTSYAPLIHHSLLLDAPLYQWHVKKDSLVALRSTHSLVLNLSYIDILLNGCKDIIFRVNTYIKFVYSI